MEQNQNTSLFGLSIDPNSKTHLAEAARWARFLAIVGFIVCGLIVLIGIFIGSFMGLLMGNMPGGEYGGGSINAGSFGTALSVYYILIALVYFFPCLFFLRFANQMKSALVSNDQEMLNSSFQNLKKTFRYLGILMIIALAFMALGLLMVIIGGATAGF